MIETFIQALIEGLMPLLGTIIMVYAIPALVNFMREKKILQDEAKMRILQSALENSAYVALAKGGRGTSGMLSGAELALARKQGTDYVKSSVPDKVKEFKLTDEKIEELILPHIQRAVMKNSQGALGPSGSEKA